VLGLFFAGALSSHADTLSFQEGVSPSGGYVADNTYIRTGSYTNTPQDDDPQDEIIVGWAGSVMRPMFEFDLTQIETDAGGNPFTIDSVRLVVTSRGANQGTTTLNLDLHEYDFAFVEEDATWNDPDGDGAAGTGDTTAGGTLGTTLSSLAVASPSAISLGDTLTLTNSAAFRTAVTNALNAGDNTLRLLLKGDVTSGGNSFVRLYDETFATTGYRPELVVDFTITLPPGSTTSFQEGVSPTPGYAHDAVYIRENQPTTNQNGDSDQELLIGFLNDNTEVRGLLEFDVSTIPAVNTINTVSLVMRREAPQGGLSASITINVYEYDYDIVESVSDWQDPDGDNSDVTGDTTYGGTLGTLLTSATFDPTVQDADVTFGTSAAFRTAATNALAGDGILRLILARSDGSGSGSHRFARFDDETVTPAGNRPELLVNHSVPAGSGTITWYDPGVSNITTNAANAYATLGGTNAEVTLYWKQGSSAPQQHTGWDGTNDVPPGLTSTGLVERAITNLAPDTLYSFIFYGTNSSIPTNGWSDSVSFTSALSSVQTPDFTNATVVGATVALGWQDNASNETAYILMRSTNPATDYVTITTLVANTESYVDSGLSAETYYYRLAATNSANESVTDFAACQTNATVDVTAFQEGVLPTPAYTHDAVFIRENQAGTNQDDDPDQELIVGFLTDDTELRGLLEFDVSAIPAGNTVGSASLVMRRESPVGGQSASITINVYEYDYDVDETNATWNVPDSGGSDVAGGTLGTLLTSATFDPTVKDADVTFGDSATFRTAVSDALAGDGFLRLMLARSDSSGAGANRFARFDDETVTPAANRPELLVSHQPPAAGAITWTGVGVSNITADAADAYATLGGADAEVTVYWKEGTTNAPFGHTGWSGTNDLPAGLISTGLVERAITGLQADTLYTYVFYGTNSTPTNAWSTAKTFITALSSSQEPIFTSAGGGSTITLGWQDNASNETGYVLQRSENSGGPYVVIDDTLAANTESYADSGLALGTYYYRLAATNSANGSVTDFAACQTNADVDVVAPATTIIANYTFDGGSATSTDSEPNSTAADFTKNPASSDWGFSLGGNVFARSTATTASEASAIAAGDYFSFTVTPNAGIEMDLAQLTFDTTHNLTGGGSPDTGAEMMFFVRSSVDNFTANIGTTYTQAWNTSTSRTLDLSGVSFQDVSAATEFRFYIYDSGVDDFDNGARTDDVILEGKAYRARTTGFQEGVSPTAAYAHDATFIHEKHPGNNWDTYGSLIAGPNVDGFRIRSLLEFDVSAISADDEIDSVALILKTHATEDGSGGNNTFNVYAYGYDIVEASATWNAPATGDGTVGGTLGTLLTSATFDSTMKSVDITFGDTAAFRTAVADALAGDGFLRMIIANNDEATDDNLVWFHHDEFATELDRPELLVIHSAPEAGTLFIFR
jgi:hypothetical protein